MKTRPCIPADPQRAERTVLSTPLPVRFLTFLFLLMAAAPVPAADDDPHDDVLGDGMWQQEGIREYRWHEEKAALPSLPAKDTLVSLDVPRRDYDRNHYAIDTASISIGAQDGVVRYTVVIETSSGVRNILYEGIRCETHEYRTIAYATGRDQAFHLMQGTQWKRITDEGAYRYRQTLFDNYVCGNFLDKNTVAGIVNRLKYPPASAVDDFTE